MSRKQNHIFSRNLQDKLNLLNKLRTRKVIADIEFYSSLLLAPMAGATSLPFRKLMSDLGSGGSISELVSAQSIICKNETTLKMLTVSPNESPVGLQLFGNNAYDISKAASIAQNYSPQFIDINMGCPVKKVISKGGGSALMNDPKKLIGFFKEIKKNISIPLSIKIRMGISAEHITANEIINIATGEGVDFVTLHGRTQVQKYTGRANWDFIEQEAEASKIPIIGNGDLSFPIKINELMNNTNCNALMIGRASLKNPFIFIESMLNDENYMYKQKTRLFTGDDYFEVIKILSEYIDNYFLADKVKITQLQKHIVWFASCFDGVANFRKRVFSIQKVSDLINLSEDFFKSNTFLC